MKHLRVEVTPKLANEFMNEHVLCLPAGLEIGQAVRRLLRRGYSGAPVVDDDGVLVGMLSELDCVRVLALAAYEGWPAGTVGDHMSRDVEAITPSADVFTLASKFAAGRHRRFPVVDEGRRVMGLVTRRDLLRALDDFRAEQERARLANTYELIEHRRRTLG